MPIQDFQPVIGLEVHAQLLTKTKIFCGCSTTFGAAPNANTCAICLGMPGVLPVLNGRVVEFTVRTGLAIDCQIKPVSVWSRKNYFYPDLPKGYQITQYDQPICEHGKLTIDTEAGEKTIRVLRIHMEEDAGKNVHDEGGGDSLVDLNRAGVPLMEIVSEPDMRTSEEAAEYLRTLRDILVYLGVNDGNLEEGSFRCDANVSVMPRGSDKFGQRVELKNINSFRYVKQAIDYEITRQVELIEGGGKVKQETRLFDPAAGETRSMRSKEDAHDYRYFPEPDLLPLHVPKELVEKERAALPELPRAKMKRFQSAYGLTAYDARILCAEQPLASYFETAAKAYGDPRKLSHWIQGELLRFFKEEGGSVATLKTKPEQLVSLLKLVDEGKVSANSGKEVLGEMLRTGQDADPIIQARGLAQVTDAGAVESTVDSILAANASEVEKYRAGKKQVFGFLVGQVMRAMKGKGNPGLVNDLLKKKLGD